jgi:hypothetical protein
VSGEGRLWNKTMIPIPGIALLSIDGVPGCCSLIKINPLGILQIETPSSAYPFL